MHIHRSYIFSNKEQETIKLGVIHLVRTQSFPKKLTIPNPRYEHERIRDKKC